MLLRVFGNRVDNFRMETCVLVVLATRNDFFTRGSQHNRVLELSGIRASDVDERRVSFNRALITEIFESHLIFGTAGTI